MTSIRVTTTIAAPPDVVWSVVEVVADHVEWMHDAVAIDFTSERTSGVGTTFDCATKVGPFRLTDRMEITEWVEGRSMGVRHVGLVTGSGTFTLAPLDGGRTAFTWSETLHVPWWMGGRLGEWFGAPVLRWIWNRNLRELRAIVESRNAAP